MAAVIVANASRSLFGRHGWALFPKSTSCVVIQNRDASDIATMKRGTGGRSSFSGTVATVFGASGFLGRYVVNKLGKVGSQVIIPYRCDASEVRDLRLCGDLGQVLFFPFQLRDEESIRKTVQYSNVVINLIGREWETKNYKFHDVHVEGSRRLARIAKECGVEKFIHVSHLNGNEKIQKIWSESKYLRSKYESELAVREEFPEAIIFKPSDMHGDEDMFLNYWAHKTRSNFIRNRLGLWKLGEETIKQPVYVGDVASGIAAAINNPGVLGRNVDCVGPERYYLADIVDYIIRVLRRDDEMYRVELNPLVKLKGMVFNAMPFRPRYTPDKLERDGITDWTNPKNLSLEDLDVQLTDLVLRIYYQLHPRRRDACYQEYLGEFPDPAPPLPASHYQEKKVVV